jgi:hypothetical protein
VPDRPPPNLVIAFGQHLFRAYGKQHVFGPRLAMFQHFSGIFAQPIGDFERRDTIAIRQIGVQSPKETAEWRA